MIAVSQLGAYACGLGTDLTAVYDANLNLIQRLGFPSIVVVAKNEGMRKWPWPSQFSNQ